MGPMCPVSSLRVKYLEIARDQSYLIVRFYLSAPSPARNRRIHRPLLAFPKPRASRPSV